MYPCKDEKNPTPLSPRNGVIINLAHGTLDQVFVGIPAVRRILSKWQDLVKPKRDPKLHLGGILQGWWATAVGVKVLDLRF